MKFFNMKGYSVWIVTTTHGIGDVEYVVIAKDKSEVRAFIKERDIVAGKNCYTLTIRQVGGADGYDNWQDSIWVSKFNIFKLIKFKFKQFI